MGALDKLIETLGIEEIPYPFSRFYGWVAKKHPYLRDFYKQIAIQISGQIKSGKILDVGTGPGYLPIEIAKAIPRIEVLGIDISEDMVRQARKNTEEAELSDRVKFKVEDANKMSFEDFSFDFIVSTGVFHHWLKPLDPINEIYRILKKGGEAWIIDQNKNAPKEEADKIKKKYGRLLGAIISRALKLHSTTPEKAHTVLRDARNKFKHYEIVEKETALILKLYKV